MDTQDRETLRKNRSNLRDNIADPDAVIELLYERDVFTEALKQEVEAETTRIKKINKILDILPLRGKQAFDQFCQILMDTKNDDAAAFLKPTRPVEELEEFEELEELPLDWPNKNAMTEEIKVIHCSRTSDVYKKNWNTSMTYSMKKKIRGRAIIINNRTFHGLFGKDVSMLSVRHGTEMDRDRLKVLFHQLHFDVCVHEDKSAQEILDVLAAEIGDPYHSAADCFILVILSHGTNTGIYGVDGEVVSVENITGLFASNTCPNLAGKPKIFIIQADRGENKDLGGIVSTRPDISYTAEIPKKTKHMSLKQILERYAIQNPVLSSENRISTRQDIFIAFATHPGFVSMRNTLYGSWFIQAMIWVFQRHACAEDLSTLFRMVIRIVSNGRTSDFASEMDIIQTPCIEDSFIKKFYFFPSCHE